MSEIRAGSGVDTWLRDDHPRRPNAGTNRIRLQHNHRVGLVFNPVTGIRGRTVLNSWITGRVAGGFAAQTVTASRIKDKWRAGDATWENPPTTGLSIATVLGATSDGTAVDLDITSIMQSVANGNEWRGLLLETSATAVGDSDWYSFDSGQPAWVVHVELADAPEQPSDLRPNGGSVGSHAPVLAWSYNDSGGDDSEQSAFQVQVDPGADGASPDFDTGWVASGDPQYDLSSGGFTPLSSGDSTQWRVRTKDSSVVPEQSQWSDWASFTYTPYRTLIMDSPTGGVIGDNTPDVIAHLSGGTLDHWRVRVLAASGDVRWNSGLQTGPISITVPKRNRQNRKIIRRDDATYTIQVRAFDRVDRTPAVGLPAYVEQLVDVVFDEDAGVGAPSAFAMAPATLGDPRVTFSWFRSLSANWMIVDTGSGEIIARLDDGEPSVSAGTYSWTDSGLIAPRQASTYVVRAIESGVRSHASNVVTYSSKPLGVWLVPSDGTTPIFMRGVVAVDQFLTNDRRTSYSPLNSDTDIDVVWGQEGVSGTFSGTISNHPGGPDVFPAVRRLSELKGDIFQLPQMVWATQSVPVRVRNLTVLPSSDYNDDNKRHNVSFSFIQVGD